MLRQVKVRNNPRFQFSDIKTFNFKPGLNLIVGANTSGKSSLLEIIKKFYGFDDSWGRTDQNLKYHNNLVTTLKKEQGATIDGCLNKFVHYNPAEYKEKSNIDFVTGGVRNFILSRFQSYGEGRKSYHNWFVEFLNKNNVFTLEEETLLHNEHLEWDKTLTIVADEPENSMAINMQFGLFDWFLEFCKTYPRVQIIIATHSIAAFALTNNPDINVIEMNKGWVKRIKDRCKNLF